MDEQRVQTGLYAAAAVLIAVVGGAFVVRRGDSAAWAYGLVALGTVFFAVSAVPRVREHEAYNALGAAFAAAVCTVGYVGSGTLLVGILAVFSAVGTLVELYNWRAGTEYMRL
ncbi:phosphatidate cytidylyltransferase [Halolamina sp. CBA1230]|uniref:hypothetical protein n=1 Tax=Halolamina sp. CBA1230 TaxID=1853690 RepID=UPI0009A1E1E1|nr:hypothetical protein [Halolamina sp. CBA1230]QKY21157.1 phosphatidate cytidylyltransferase [Halolamina sp. CBA1230]